MSGPACIAQVTTSVCVQCPLQSRKELEDMVVLFFAETWWSLVHANFWSALPSCVVTKVS